MIELNRDSPVNAVGREAAHRSLPCVLVCQFDQTPLPPLNQQPIPSRGSTKPSHAIKPTKIRDVNFTVPAGVHAAFLATSGDQASVLYCKPMNTETFSVRLDPSRFPGSNPFADARVRNAFASVKRGERFGDPGNLPLVGIEVGGDRLGREERSAATSALGELFKAALGRVTYAN